MKYDISAFNAKTHLSELLRETEKGRSFTICRRGKPVARLVPIPAQETEFEGAVARLRGLRGSVKGGGSIRKLIDEGRRF